MQPFGTYPVKKYQPNNTYRALIKVLNDKPFLSENELMIEAFGYNRNTSCHSNKKYADMLRRTLQRGEIRRVEAKVEGCKAKYFYYLNGERRHLKDVRKIVNSSINKKDKENMKKLNYDLIRSEVLVSRKETRFDDCCTTDIESLSPEVICMLSELPIREIEYDLALGDIILGINTQHWILKYGRRYFYVDTQGYDYARYTGELTGDVEGVLELNVPEPLEEQQNDRTFITNKKDKDMKNQVKEVNKCLMVNLDVPFEIGSVKGTEQYQICLYINSEDKYAADIDVLDTADVTFHGMEVKGYDGFRRLVSTFDEYGVDLNNEILKQTLDLAKAKAEELKIKYKALMLM